MPRRPKPGDPEKLRKKLIGLLEDFEAALLQSDLRAKVCELVPANFLLRDLGISLWKEESEASARNRILAYLKRHVGIVIDGDELMVIAGISEYARRVRELRVEYGWNILSGVTVSEMRDSAKEDDEAELDDLPEMKSDQYILLSSEEDREAAYRWNLVKEIRKQKGVGVRDKVLRFLRKNVGKPVTGEELRKVSGDKTEWARRTRELRTEFGWPIATKSNGRPDLDVGVYLLEKDEQSPPHDRHIKDSVRRTVLQRDGYACQRCQWTFSQWNKSDPRHLEVHHIIHHAAGGENLEENLVTYCNICHDEIHRKEGSCDR